MSLGSIFRHVSCNMELSCKSRALCISRGSTNVRTRPSDDVVDSLEISDTKM